MRDESTTEKIRTFWTVRPLNLQENLSIDLGRRNRAGVYFTSEERANDFKKADFVDRKWKVVEMASEAFIDWLRQRIKGGTHFIYRDPSNLFCLGSSIRVLELLTEIEESHSNGSIGMATNGRLQQSNAVSVARHPRRAVALAHRQRA